MSDNWQPPTPNIEGDIEVVVEAAAEIEERLPHLSNEPASVLPSSALRGTTFEDLLSSADRDAFIAFRNGIV